MLVHWLFNMFTLCTWDSRTGCGVTVKVFLYASEHDDTINSLTVSSQVYKFSVSYAYVDTIYIIYLQIKPSPGIKTLAYTDFLLYLSIAYKGGHQETW